MKKGDETRSKILDKGFELASTLGLEGLSIGVLAAATGLSKSGLFAHFHSKENLQLSVMEHAGDIFTRDVVAPALRSPSGIPRIRKVMGNWIQWTKDLSGGCIFVAAAAEYSDRPGLVRGFILKQQDQWIDCLKRITVSAIQVGELREETDPETFAFELYSLIMGFYLYHNSLGHPKADALMSDAFERLIDAYRPAT